jgi:hypothetical protein
LTGVPYKNTHGHTAHIPPEMLALAALGTVCALTPCLWAEDGAGANGGPLLRLRADLVLCDGLGNIIRERRRFGCDGASVPRIVDWSGQQRRSYPIAYFPHDGQYQRHIVEYWDAAANLWRWARVSRSYADRLLRRVLADVYRVRPSQSAAWYAAVRIGGLWSWHTGTCDWRCAGVAPCPQEHDGCPWRDHAPQPPPITKEF